KLHKISNQKITNIKFTLDKLSTSILNSFCLKKRFNFPLSIIGFFIKIIINYNSNPCFKLKIEIYPWPLN
ncbi:hypothetical protein BpHYR1_038463, partial [Brachionus plicatilis]